MSHKPFRDLIRLFGVALIRLVYRIEVVHPERLPKTGGVLLLPNHVTFADAFFITAASPRPVRFVMDHAFMAHPLIRGFASIFQTLTIRRDQPREAIRTTIDALQNGDVVCLFPEGQLTRTGTLCELRRGFELIARKAGHPLIPMWCDGTWGSIFSFERGRFFKKTPYHIPYPLSIAFGAEINPENADLQTVREGLLTASAEAVNKRFESSKWESKQPMGPPMSLARFNEASARERRRFWVNGYQIGQVNALSRRQPFHMLASDLLQSEIPGLSLTFPSLFKAEVKIHQEFEPSLSGVWVGGDRLRDCIENIAKTEKTTFYDFSSRSLEPIDRPGLLHFPCLAIEGIVISMSMPDPPRSKDNSETQRGYKAGTWGKLLPGFCLSGQIGNLTIHGPALPDLGRPLKATLDPEGFILPSP